MSQNGSKWLKMAAQFALTSSYDDVGRDMAGWVAAVSHHGRSGRMVRRRLQTVRPSRVLGIAGRTYQETDFSTSPGSDVFVHQHADIVQHTWWPRRWHATPVASRGDAASSDVVTSVGVTGTGVSGAGVSGAGVSGAGVSGHAARGDGVSGDSVIIPPPVTAVWKTMTG